MTLLYACEPLTTSAALVAYGCNCDLVEGAELTALIEQASDVIFILSNGVVAGRCESSVRPVSNAICFPSTLVERIFGGTQINDLASIELTGIDPTVSEVKIDGAVLTAGVDWIVSSSDAVLSRYLVRLNSDGNPSAWPTGQRWWRPDSEDRTFSVTYESGLSASAPGVAKAANEVSCWLVNDTAERRRRRLDPRATSATGGGVNLGVRDRAEQVKSGQVDLPALSELLALYAPNGRKAVGPQVMSPEMGDGWTFYSQPAAA